MACIFSLLLLVAPAILPTGTGMGEAPGAYETQPTLLESGSLGSPQEADGAAALWPAPGACAPAPGAGVPPATVGVRVLAPASAFAGQIVRCRIRVYNLSPVAVYHVEVRDRLATAVEVVGSSPPAEHRDSLLVWRFDQLRPGEVREIVLQLRPSTAGPLRQCVRLRYEHGVCVETDVQAPAKPVGQAQLELAKEGPTQVLSGASVLVRLTVRNRGQAPAEDVVVVDELPEGLEHADAGQRLTFFLGQLAPGQQRIVEYRALARRPGQWTNRAHVQARGGLLAFASQTITVSEPKLALHLEAPAQVSVGNTVTVRLTISNASQVPLPQVRVSYHLPAAASVVETQPQASRTAQVLSWTIAQLKPGEKETVILRLRLGAAGTVEHRVAAAVGAWQFREQRQTKVVGAAGLLLVVVDSDDPVLVGQDTRYHLIVRNQGSAPATNIRLRVEVPAELAITRVQGPSDHKREGQNLLFEPLHLPPNTDRIYRISVRALKPGVVRLRVEMTADQLRAGPVRAEESTTILEGGGF
ncbi:Large cysteine-rich periplasmic protein OmcB [bacterium HR36]|nr:Large cysteine-rich periplasmic protein OmcB [bacterium HR36]